MTTRFEGPTSNEAGSPRLDGDRLEGVGPTVAPTRRELLKQSGLLAATGLGAFTLAGLVPRVSAAAASDEPAVSPYQQLAENAVIFGGPAVLYDTWRKEWLKHKLPVNRLRIGLEPATPQTPAVAPNVDTLYGKVWLDMTRGPVIVKVPKIDPDRYYSFQFLDMWSNPFAYVGTRTNGNEAGTYALIPPGWKGRLPKGVTRIRATTKWAFGLVRTLVKDPADFKAATKVEWSYRVGPLTPSYPHGVLRPVSDQKTAFLPIFPTGPQIFESLGVGLFQQINQAILRFPPLPPDAAYVKTLRPIGIGVNKYRPPSSARGPELEAAIASALKAVVAAVPTYSTIVNGWSTNLGVTPLTHDPLRRFAQTFYGPGTNTKEESIYWSQRTYQGAPLSGASSYELVFPKGQQPPFDRGGFWSLILYSVPASALVENPIKRYEIASHVSGLITRPDGSVSITVSNAQPPDPTTNWLPAPTGPFSLTIRDYLPSKAAMNQTWKPPALQKL